MAYSKWTLPRVAATCNLKQSKARFLTIAEIVNDAMHHPDYTSNPGPHREAAFLKIVDIYAYAAYEQSLLKRKPKTTVNQPDNDSNPPASPINPPPAESSPSA